MNLLLLLSLIVNAQKFEPVNSKKDKLEYKGYTIALLSAKGNSYGYTVAKDSVVIISQLRNPFTMGPIGLLKKEDVFKVVKWQIENKPADKKSETSFFYRRIPFEVSKELEIALQ